MRLNHEDKSVTAHEAKLSPQAQAAYDRLTADLALTPAEQNEIGRRVALAEEAVNRDKPHRVAMRELAEPTRQEAAAIAEAQAAYDTVAQRQNAARGRYLAAEREMREALSAGGRHYTADPDAATRMTQADLDLAAAELAFNLVTTEVTFASEALGRVRGTINRAAVLRQRQFVAGRI